MRRESRAAEKKFISPTRNYVAIPSDYRAPVQLRLWTLNAVGLKLGMTAYCNLPNGAPNGVFLSSSAGAMDGGVLRLSC